MIRINLRKLVKSEQTKNHQGTTNEDESDGGRMYATGSKMCPVSSFEKYLSKRNSKTTLCSGVPVVNLVTYTWFGDKAS
jgi:hypothetical protein